MPSSSRTSRTRPVGRGNPAWASPSPSATPTRMARARAAEEAWRTGILTGLRRIEEGGVRSMSGLQWFETPESTLAGTSRGTRHELPDRPQPPAGRLLGRPGRIKVSGRGTLWLVGRGLDLSTAFREAADAVGGEGGGHRVASGATLPSGTRDRFLEEANRRIAASDPDPGDRMSSPAPPAPRTRATSPRG